MLLAANITIESIQYQKICVLKVAENFLLNAHNTQYSSRSTIINQYEKIVEEKEVIAGKNWQQHSVTNCLLFSHILE